MITDVKTLSNAYDQSLAPNLVITEVNGKKIDSVEDLNKIIQYKKGKAILLKVVDSSGISRLVGLEIPE
jgi:serine protease Do